VETQAIEMTRGRYVSLLYKEDAEEMLKDLKHEIEDLKHEFEQEEMASEEERAERKRDLEESIQDLRDQMDELMEDAEEDELEEPDRLTLIDNGDHIVYRVNISGFSEREVKVRTTGTCLVIKARRTSDLGLRLNYFYIKESLPSGTNPKSMRSELDGEVLCIRLSRTPPS
jgi:HSP20 family molecular chaperone IbpA